MQLGERNPGRWLNTLPVSINEKKKYNNKKIPIASDCPLLAGINASRRNSS